MKTNIIMKSDQDRNLFGIVIRQETKTGFLNLSDLQESYTRKRIIEGWPEKRIDHILNYKYSHERIYYLLKEQGIIIPAPTGFIEEVEKQGIVRTLKKYGVFKTTGARKTKTSWCNPYIFTLISLELNPEFYAKVVFWITDKLIINRIEAGDFCRSLNASIRKFNPDGNQYMTLAKALNYIVFNKHEAGIRNTGTKEQLKELSSIEEKMAFAIDMGFIHSFDQLVLFLRKIYNKKWGTNSLNS
jgi:hypothetical protein